MKFPNNHSKAADIQKLSTLCIVGLHTIKVRGQMLWNLNLPLESCAIAQLHFHEDACLYNIHLVSSLTPSHPLTNYYLLQNKEEENLLEMWHIPQIKKATYSWQLYIVTNMKQLSISKSERNCFLSSLNCQGRNSGWDYYCQLTLTEQWTRESLKTLFLPCRHIADVEDKGERKGW